MKYILLITSIILSACSSPSSVTETYKVATMSLSTPSSIIQTIHLEPDKTEDILAQLSPEFQAFINTYQMLETNNFQKAVEQFTIMSARPDQTTQELGEFGLLQVAYDTGNMAMLSEQLEQIHLLDNKSTWLTNELFIFDILYHYETADYKTAKELLQKLPKDSILSNDNLVGVQSWLYFRENRIDEANETLQQAKQMGESKVVLTASILARTKGHQTAIEYLHAQQKTYPQSLLLALTYNNFLLATDPQQANRNLHKLVNTHSNNIWLRLKVALMLRDFLSADTIDLYNEQLQAIAQNEVGKNYIEYHINNMQTAMDVRSMEIYAKPLAHFNAMNYQYLLMRYTNADTDETALELLKKIEHLDPYDDSILLELANYYSSHGMTNELLAIKKKINESKRIKSDEVINLINSF